MNRVKKLSTPQLTPVKEEVLLASPSFNFQETLTDRSTDNNRIPFDGRSSFSNIRQNNIGYSEDDEDTGLPITPTSQTRKTSTSRGSSASSEEYEDDDDESDEHHHQEKKKKQQQKREKRRKRQKKRIRREKLYDIGDDEEKSTMDTDVFFERELTKGFKNIGIKFAASMLEFFIIKGENLKARSISDFSRGSYGVIVPSIWGGRGGGVDVVTKLLHGTEKKSVEELFRESGFLFSCLHPNVARIFGISKTLNVVPFNGRLGFVLEEMEMNLRDCLINYEDELDGEDILELMVQMTQGLVFIHSRRIIHFDIKLNNYLINYNRKSNNLLEKKFEVKLTDFGISRRTQRADDQIETFGGKGTLSYMAPEVVDRHRSNFSYEVDVFSLGVCFFRMWEGLKSKPLKNYIVKGSNESIWEFTEFTNTPEFLRDLVLMMLEVHPEKRKRVSAIVVLRKLYGIINNLSRFGRSQSTTTTTTKTKTRKTTTNSTNTSNNKIKKKDGISSISEMKLSPSGIDGREEEESESEEEDDDDDDSSRSFSSEEEDSEDDSDDDSDDDDDDDTDEKNKNKTL